MIEIIKPHFTYDHKGKLWRMRVGSVMMTGPTVEGLMDSYKRLWAWC